MSTIIIADAGPLIALLDPDDDHHAWSLREIRPQPGPWLVSAPALAEVAHHFGNHPSALANLRRLMPHLRHEEPAPETVLALMEKYAPAMDYADACAVLLAKAHKGSIVVTTDHRDFSTYKVPFISPKGAFHG